MLLSESKTVASGGVIGGEQVRWIWWNSDQTMDDTVEHYDLVVSTTLVESGPLEIAEHLRNTVSRVVIRHGKPSSPSLHHLYLGHLIFGMGIPDGG